jgi:hypothetical protein
VSAAREREPLWRAAILTRGRDRFANTNCGALARLALQKRLLRAGMNVSLVTIHHWTRKQQGGAYLWAIAVIAGREDVPCPQFVVMGHEGKLGGRP